ncbi:MAG: extracellular solute-binding protein [Alphaproteobacteria bacterium]|nr:extracellular solute-binding protein [Alphaproteobacteria bacterium]
MCLQFGSGVNSAKAEGNSITIGNWENYIDPQLIKEFENLSSTKVNMVTFSSNEQLEQLMEDGDIKFDLVVPSLNLFGVRGITKGYYQALDKSRIKNYKNIDPQTLQFMALSGDFDNNYAIPWASGNIVLGYIPKLIKKNLRTPPINSLSLVFDLQVVQKLRKCGVLIIDSPSEMIPMMLKYLGKNPNSEDLNDLQLALTKLKQLRPYYKYINSVEYYTQLAQGKICVALGYSNDLLMGRSKGSKKLIKNNIAVSNIREGSVAYVDSMMIPKNAKNLDAAYQFINFMLRPENSSRNSEYLQSNTSNIPAKQYLPTELLEDKIIFPSDDERSRFFSLYMQTSEYDKKRIEGWEAMKNSR